jgi:hypothetical protein
VCLVLLTFMTLIEYGLTKENTKEVITVVFEVCDNTKYQVEQGVFGNRVVSMQTTN